MHYNFSAKCFLLTLKLLDTYYADIEPRNINSPFGCSCKGQGLHKLLTYSAM